MGVDSSERHREYFINEIHIVYVCAHIRDSVKRSLFSDMLSPKP